MPLMKRPAAARRPPALIGLFLVTGALAIVGGLMLAARPDGAWLRLSPDLLVPTPFASYRVPGLVLALIVGGAQVAGGLAVLQRRRGDLRLATAAALVLGGWIAIQAMMLGALSGWHDGVEFDITADTDPATVGEHTVLSAQRIEANIGGAMEDKKSDGGGAQDKKGRYLGGDGGVQITGEKAVPDAGLSSYSGYVVFYGRLSSSRWAAWTPAKPPA